MAREKINDLVAFLAVAREQSFTKAAAKLGVSQSALSHKIRLLEGQLGIRLLTRTTRSVAPTEAGEALIEDISPHFEGIEAALNGLQAKKGEASGTVRITASDYAIEFVIWPKVKEFIIQYPSINVEFVADNSLADIVSQRFDAGVRLGEQVAKDMISVPIGPNVRFVVVGTKSYFTRCGRPQSPDDLTKHTCIGLRLQSHGGIYAWELEKDGKEVKVRINGQVVFNTILMVLRAALDGLGVAHVPEDLAAPFISNGQLVHVLDDWCPVWSGFHIYYPSRRLKSPAFSLLVDALRYPKKA
ncbi:LysR family transcriptional regulator [Asaia sp. As-1742]|uniref:LysR family transcriptional regulator n=1 Tax=Asaia sp. As-1742 TaxID=2608325 RepID=UPI001420E87A|nr:LysR family transcriptional regulator [Asaia sp. As-1742]NIE81689.1 LysR family transcriptional regulator [Asaia sp. As-1742]